MNNEQKDLLIDSASAALSELTEAALETASTSLPALAVAGGGPAAAVAAVGITLLGAKTKKYISSRGDRNQLNTFIDNCISVVGQDMHGHVPAWCKTQILEIVQKTELKAEDLVNRPSYIAELTAQAGNKYSGDERELVRRICSLVWSSLAIAIRKTESYQLALEVKCHELSRQNDKLENNLDVLWQFVNDMSQEINEIWNELEIIKQGPNYQRSFARIIDNSNPKKDNRNPFHYRNNILTFVGRSQELIILQDFLDDKRDLLWMSVTGEGGTGKSKLLYHFAEKIENQPTWKAIWITRNLMDSIMKSNEWEYPCDLLLIVDYAAEVADELGTWIEKLSETKKRPGKMRFVILERESANSESQNILPIWYMNLMSSGKRNRCLKELHYEDIELHGLNEEECPEVIREFASYEYQKELTDKDIETILGAARKMDLRNHLPRVLLVIIVADAFLRNSDFSNWNVEKLIENVINRNMEHWKSGIEKTFSRQEADAVMKSLLDMLLYATATGGWNPDEEDTVITGPFAESAKHIADLKIRGTIFSMMNYAPEETEKLNALEPDLIGECFVLVALKETYHQNKKLFEVIVEALWEKQRSFSLFIARCIENYYENGEFSILFDRALEPIFPRNKTIESDIYPSLLFTLLSYQSKEEAIETLKRLEGFVADHADNGLLVWQYVSGLISLVAKLPAEEAPETIKRLEGFVKSHADNDLIVWQYVSGLIDLVAEQPEEKAIEIIKRLEGFVSSYTDNETIVWHYVSGLIDLAKKQSEEKETEIIKRLEGFIASNSDNEDIVRYYLSGLIDLTKKQPEEKASGTIKILERLATSHMDNEVIVQAYVRGLIDLASKQPEEIALETINILGKFVKTNAYDRVIIRYYVSGLIDLVEKLPDKASEIIKKCEELTSHMGDERLFLQFVSDLIDRTRMHPEEKATKIIKGLEGAVTSRIYNEEIARIYVSGLTDLVAKQLEKKEPESIKILERLTKYKWKIEKSYVSNIIELVERKMEVDPSKAINTLERFIMAHADSDVIRWHLVCGAIALAKQQPEENASEILRILESFLTIHNDNEKTLEFFVGFLFSLTKKMPRDVSETRMIFKRFIAINANSEEKALIIANFLFDLSKTQPEEEIRDLLMMLDGLTTAYADNEDIVEIYARGLVYLASQRPENVSVEINELSRLATAHADNEDIVEAYARGLGYLAPKQPEKVVAAIKELSQLAVSYVDNEIIVEAYVGGLVHLALKQPEKASAVIKELYQLAAAHADNADIVGYYVLALSKLSLYQREIATGILEILERSATSCADKRKIAKVFEEVLRNLLIEYPRENELEIIKILEAFVTSHADNEEIVRLYATFLDIIFPYLTHNKQIEIIIILKKLAIAHADNEDLLSIYAQRLCVLGTMQPAEKTLVITKILNRLAASHTNMCIWRAYAYSLMDLSSKQTEEKAAETLKAASKFIGIYSEPLVDTYIERLLELASKQSEEKALDTIKMLKKLATAHGDKDFINLAYERGLLDLRSRCIIQNGRKNKDLKIILDQVEELLLWC